MDDPFSQGYDSGYSKAIGFVPVVIPEMVLYGMNLSLSIVTTTVLLRRRTGERMAHKRLLLTLTLMLAIATTYIVLNTLELYPFSDSFYTRSEETRQYLTLIQSALGDSVTIWRCYVIYGRSIIMIALPVSTALASFIFGMYLAGNQAVNMARNSASFTPGWFDQSWIWAAITMVCTIYCAVAISYKIYSSAYLTRNNNLFAVMFFVIETSFIYTLGVVTYVITTFATQHDVQDIIMGAIIQLPPIVLCLLLLQTKFYSKYSRAVHYVNPDTVGPLSALRRIFRSGRETSASDQMSTFRVAPSAVHDLALTMPIETHHSVVDDTLGTNDSDTNLREKGFSSVIHIV
ncbi:hypothetical protein EVG20_g7599 [Dentipellis fragilis]|uniref:Uncharacterized protein n=1 Tax=Dentipellis fragilis TaxID=205917 RepID=A0A4Y9YEH5_9AGAM|nr:hypothetical protein EVG20_g7599 [Dentipellis fragilis]